MKPTSRKCSSGRHSCYPGPLGNPNTCRTTLRNGGRGSRISGFRTRHREMCKLVLSDGMDHPEPLSGTRKHLRFANMAVKLIARRSGASSLFFLNCPHNFDGRLIISGAEQKTQEKDSLRDDHRSGRANPALQLRRSSTRRTPLPVLSWIICRLSARSFSIAVICAPCHPAPA